MNRFMLAVRFSSSVSGDAFQGGVSLNDNVYLWSESDSEQGLLSVKSDNRSLFLSFGLCFCSEASVALKRLSDSLYPSDQGQYVSIFLDMERKTASLVGDPGGVRSLFWYLSADTLYISSSLQLFGMYGVCRELEPDQDVEKFLLRYGYLFSNHTVYKNIYELKPNDSLLFEFGHEITHRKLQLAKSEYKGAPSAEIISEAEKYLHGLIQKIVSEQVAGHSHVAVLLGGFDSALVAEVAVSLGVKVTTYTFRYADQAYNQPFVDRLADIPGITTKWVDITPAGLANILQQYSRVSNFPCLWLGYVLQTAIVCEEIARDGLSVCLSGDGCDTAFLGYPSTHKRGSIYKKLPRIPSHVTNTLIGSLEVLRPENFLGHPYRVIKSLLRSAHFEAKDRAFHSFQVFDRYGYSKLIPQGTAIDHEIGAKGAAAIATVSEEFKTLSYERQLYHAKSLISPNRNKLVTSSDLSGVVIQSPYMDQRLKQFVKLFPDSFFRSQSGADEGKELLMEMAEKYTRLSVEIIRQKKLAAISSPIDQWLEKDLREICRNHVLSSHFSPDEKYLDSLLDDLAVEKFYKKYGSADRVDSVAASLLVTYASFFSDVI